MRKRLILSFCGLVFIFSCSLEPIPKENDLDTNQKLAGLCKLWGFMKYYHPVVGSGQLDWDSVLITTIPKILDSKSKTDYQGALIKMIPPLNFTNSQNEDSILLNDYFFLNLNLGFLSDTVCYSKEIINTSRLILMNKTPYDNSYIRGTPYALNPILDSDSAYFLPALPDMKIRLLALFRYWNIINYFYPYKYLVDKDWNDVLLDFIPKFICAEDTLEYHLTVRKLVTHINDNHGFANSRVIKEYVGVYSLPVRFRTVDGNHVVYSYISESLAKENSLFKGDILISLNGKSINQIKDSLECIISGSNKTTITNKVNLYLRKTKDSIVSMEVMRNDSIFTIKSKTYTQDEINIIKQKKDEYTRIISEDIVYVNLSNIEYYEVDSIFSPLISSKVIILDLRQNCSFIIHDICDYILGSETSFYTVMRPNYKYPGLFNIMEGGKTGPSKRNNLIFQGELVILIDENTQSIGEFTAMALLQYPKAFIIGNKSSGANGNVSIAYLPGGITTYFSGIGIYYPHFKQTQRIGLLPDSIILQTIEGISHNVDEVYEYAIEYAKRIAEQ